MYAGRLVRALFLPEGRRERRRGRRGISSGETPRGDAEEEEDVARGGENRTSLDSVGKGYMNRQSEALGPS